MTRWHGILLALSVSIFSACSTAYVPEGMSHCSVIGFCRGGYSEQQLSENTYSVSFLGNKRTARQTTQTYLVYRCAEVTLNSGHDYFIFVNESTDKDGDKYRSNAVIQVLTEGEPTNNQRAYNAREVIANLSPQIRW